MKSGYLSFALKSVNRAMGFWSRSHDACMQGSTHLMTGKSAKVVPETIFTAVQRSRIERRTDDQWQNKAYGMSSSGETASDTMMVS